ncbi:MAG: hypothetical protein HQ574_03575 [Chloroflexi bacterium]|nr:hypothetical protein [Chloroflexota bacterium]
MTPNDERLEILEMIQQGKISPDEGLKLIEALGESWDVAQKEYIIAKAEMEGQVSGDDFQSEDPEIDLEDLNKWRGWWVVPFWIGVGITVLGGSLIYSVWSNRGIGFGFIASWIPFLLGISILVLGWNSRTGPWLHLRIQQKPGEKPERIAISIPIPYRLFSWSIQTFGSFVSGKDKIVLESILPVLGNYTPGDMPLSVDINDDDSNEKVRIYIG